MGNINIRTDLAVELNEAVDKSDSRYSGRSEEHTSELQSHA